MILKILVSFCTLQQVHFSIIEKINFSKGLSFNVHAEFLGEIESIEQKSKISKTARTSYKGCWYVRNVLAWYESI